MAYIIGKLKQEKDKGLASGNKINEKQIKERLEKETLTEKEKKLVEQRVILTPAVYDILWRFFDFHKHNTNEKV